MCHTCHACQCGLRAKVPNACQLLIFMCQRITVPMHKATCQWCVGFSTWHPNVPNDVPIFHFGMPTWQKVCQFFKYSSNFYTLLLYKKFYIILDIIYDMYDIWYVYALYIKVLLYFISILLCHIKEKCRIFVF